MGRISGYVSTLSTVAVPLSIGLSGKSTHLNLWARPQGCARCQGCPGSPPAALLLAGGGTGRG